MLDGLQPAANGVQPQKMRSHFARNHEQHAHTILDEVLDQSPGVTWGDIAGLEVAKQILQVHTPLNASDVSSTRFLRESDGDILCRKL